MKPYEMAEAIDSLYFGNVKCPGLVRIEGLQESDPKWENRKAAGNAGANTILHGSDPREFTVSVQLGGEIVGEETDDFDLWIDFAALVKSTTSGPKPMALPIYHPDIAAAGITEATNGGITAPVYDGLGGAVVKIKFREFRPPKAKAPTVAGASNAPGAGPPKHDPNAAAKAELDALGKEAAAP